MLNHAVKCFVAGEAVMTISIDEITVDNYVPTPTSTPGHACASSAPTPRPKSVLSQEALHNYSLNKIFFHLLDLLEHQDKMKMEHPFVNFLRVKFGGAEILHVSRKDASLLLKFPSTNTCKKFQEMARRGSLDAEIGSYILSSLILKELGVKDIKIKISV